MHIAVNVCSRDPRHREYEQTTDCLIVFVALDADGHPIPVPNGAGHAGGYRAANGAIRLMELCHDIQQELRMFESAASA